MWPQIIASIVAIPELLKEVRKLTGLIEKGIDPQYKKDLESARDLIEKAKTQDEVNNASKVLNDLISRS